MSFFRSIVIASIIALPGFNCTKSKSNDDESAAVAEAEIAQPVLEEEVVEGVNHAPQEVVSGNPLFIGFLEVVFKNCLGCHSEPSFGNFSELTSELDWAASPFLLPGSPQESSIFTKLKSQGGNMPPEGELLEEDVQKIRNFILHWSTAKNPIYQNSAAIGEESTVEEAIVVSINNPYFEAFSKIIEKDCLSCHSSSLYGDFSKIASYKDWLDSKYIVPGSPVSSSLYSRLKNNGGDMPSNQTTLSNEDNETIKKFILTSESIQSDSFLGMSPRIGNRDYVISVFENVFGTGHKLNGEDILIKNLYKNYVYFQGSCDLYGTAQPKGGIPEFYSHHCYFKGSNSKQANIGQSNSVRQGWVIQTCEQLTSIDEAVNHALSINLGLDVPHSTPTPETIARAYQLFYPGKKIPYEVNRALFNVVEGTTGSFEKWRWALLTLCLSAKWQIM